jgi:hypothetical protein
MVASAPEVAEVAFGEEALRWLEQSSSPHAAYWALFVRERPEKLAANFHATAAVQRLNGRLWPLSINHGEGGEEGAYPCSLLTQYVRYPLAELSLVPSRLLRIGAWAGLALLGVALRLGRVDRSVQWSSSLLSTDLHDPALGAEAGEAARVLSERFPDRAILIRNIHAFGHPDLPDRLRSCGFELFTSRQIYFFDGTTGGFGARSDVKRDWKALRSLKDYTVVEHSQFACSEVPRILELYRMLYLEKHSMLNPQYTERFVEEALQGGLLEFRGLRHSSGRLDGVFACFSRGEVTSTPFIGYDTTLPAELGLYRLLVALLLQRVAGDKVLLNYSSGAGEFKRRRGGEPAIEWNAVYVRHLPWHRRAAYRLLQFSANRFGRRFLEDNQI